MMVMVTPVVTGMVVVVLVLTVMVMVTPVVTGMVVVMVLLVVLNCDGHGHSSCDRDGGSDGDVGGVKL